ncbi:hypothetical protein D3C73_916090 [compost metagenome]
MHGEGALADLLQGAEILDRAGTQQAMIEEGLHQGQDDLAVDVVLKMLVRLIADAHRLHAAIAFDAVDDTLDDGRLQPYPIDRLDMPSRRGVDQIAQVAEVAFQDVHRAQPVQRPHRIVGVADPAVAIVPVAPAFGEFRHGGGHRGDDGAGLLIDAQLQGDGGADHRFLPVQRQVEGPGPVLPVRNGQVQGGVDARQDRLIITFIRSQEEGHLLLQTESPLVQHMADRAVGGQPQGHIAAQIADVVGARGMLSAARAPVGRRAQAYGDARRSDQRTHHAREGHRAVDARMLQVARAEVDDLHRGAVGSRQHRPQDGGVADVFLLDGDLAFQFDRPEAVLGGGAVHEGRKDGIAVDARGAGPDKPPLAVDQGADRTVADGRQIQVGRHARASFSSAAEEARAPSQSSTASTFSSL